MASEYLQLAQPAKDKNYPGWLASEKLDGMLAFWDGGVSKGLPVSEVPWGNSADKGHRIHGLVATGLWSRYGNPIYYPEGWADSLPRQLALTGELFLGHGKFQTLLSTVKKYNPSWSDWAKVRFMLLDTPTVSFFLPRNITIRVGSKKTALLIRDGRDFAEGRGLKMLSNLLPFTDRQDTLRSWYYGTPEPTFANNIEMVEQYDTDDQSFDLAEFTSQIVASGGEGSMLKDPKSLWIPTRTSDLVKIKPFFEGQAEVVGYQPGKGKFEGLVGSLTCVEIMESSGTRAMYSFNLSGLTDRERAIGYFPAGTIVEFRYRKRTDSGVPFEARYARYV